MRRIYDQCGSQHLYSYTGNNPINYVDPTGHFWENTNEDENPVAYIFYTSKNYNPFKTSDNWKFTAQAKNQKKILQEQGYSVISIKTDSKDEFIKEWNSIGTNVAEIFIFAHGSGDYLAFSPKIGDGIYVEDGAKANSYIENPDSMYNKDTIPYISKVLNKTTANITILSCNARHKDFEPNVMDEFLSVTSGSVTAFDGSVSFYENNWRAFWKTTKGYGPRLSSD